MERNQIFDNRASARYTVAGLVATLPEGKKSDFFAPSRASGADGAFLSALQTRTGKRAPVLGVRLGPSKLVGYLDGRNPRPRHGRRSGTTYAAITPAPLSGGLEVQGVEATIPVLQAWPVFDRSQDFTERRGSSRATRIRDGF